MRFRSVCTCILGLGGWLEVQSSKSSREFLPKFLPFFRLRFVPFDHCSCVKGWFYPYFEFFLYFSTDLRSSRSIKVFVAPVTRVQSVCSFQAGFFQFFQFAASRSSMKVIIASSVFVLVVNFYFSMKAAISWIHATLFCWGSMWVGGHLACLGWRGGVKGSDNQEVVAPEV